MRKTNRKQEQGVALLLALLALMLLSAIAAGMMFMSSTETSIGANFKSEEQAYFSARAGVEEVRDRMLVNNPNTINASLPTTLPAAGGGVLYVLNGATPANITGLGSSLMADDELCHDFSYGGMTSVPANVRCTTLPAGTGWFTTTASAAPYALDYKWVRVTLKANNSAPYLVDSAQAGNLQTCWNGASEVVAPAGTACSALATTASPVYLVTALAMTSSGARRIVQQEIGQKPVGTFPGGGMFATGVGCGALALGGGAQTGSFNSAGEGTPTDPPTNQTNTNGNVGANGNIGVQGTSASVNGTISTNQPATVGACPGSGVTVSGTPGIGGISNFPTPYTPPVPPLPNPLPPVTNKIYKNKTLTAGAYGNITLQGTVTLTGGTVAHPAVYTINSLTMNGGATLVINKPVIINFAGIGVATVLDMTGGSFSNNSFIPSYFQINYGGTDTMIISGGNQAFAVIDAPNAAISFKGGSNFYGQAIGNTIDDRGGTNFYWDTSLATPPPVNTNTFHEIALRELSY